MSKSKLAVLSFLMVFATGAAHASEVSARINSCLERQMAACDVLALGNSNDYLELKTSDLKDCKQAIAPGVRTLVFTSNSLLTAGQSSDQLITVSVGKSAVKIAKVRDRSLRGYHLARVCPANSAVLKVDLDKDGKVFKGRYFVPTETGHVVMVGLDGKLYELADSKGGAYTTVTGVSVASDNSGIILDRGSSSSVFLSLGQIELRIATGKIASIK